MRNETRRSARVRSRIRVKVSVRGKTYDGYVLDVSEGGMRLSTDVVADLWQGDRIEIECGDLGKVSGQVRWRDPGRFGMKFGDTVDKAVRAKFIAQFGPRAA